MNSVSVGPVCQRALIVAEGLGSLRHCFALQQIQQCGTHRAPADILASRLESCHARLTNYGAAASDLSVMRRNNLTF